MSNSIDDVTSRIQKFADDRDWNQFHTPKNLIMAATSELGELAETLQWKSEVEVQEFIESEYGRSRVSEEIADVAIYLIRLCQKIEVDFTEILLAKIDQNESKYPVSTSKGSSKKYNEL
jgi:NTP pyrophosphatase (non-canonical NTP hydrolase)